MTNASRQVSLSATELVEFREVKRKVDVAIQRFLKNDAILLEIDANERSVTHMLAVYLGNEFPDWHVDCEYNRKMGDPKRWPRPKREGVRANDPTVFPDIIVHLRKTDDNLLVLEMKLSTNTEDPDGAFDAEKLKYFTDLDKELKYRWGVFLKFRAKQLPVELMRSVWFAKGEIMADNTQVVG